MLDGFKMMWRDKITYEAIRPISAIRALYKTDNIQVRLRLLATQACPPTALLLVPLTFVNVCIVISLNICFVVLPFPQTYAGLTPGFHSRIHLLDCELGSMRACVQMQGLWRPR